MLTFDVPFIPEVAYVEFLQTCSSRLHSLFFSLFSPHAVDARHRFETHEATALAEFLAKISGPKKYALLNSRFNHPDWYLEKEPIRELIEVLETLAKAQAIDGLIFGDMYQLQALSDEAPQLCSTLEAVPSINFLPDSAEKIRALLFQVERLAFKQPGKIILDRALNRNMPALKQVTQDVRREFPGMKIGLLANEGCLYQCPYKPAHDALIAHSAVGAHPDRTFAINQQLGCMRHLKEHPHHLLASPIIRPEDMHKYSNVADVIKICGRNKGGSHFLMAVIQAYLDESYTGNLLDLTDSMEWLAQQVHVPNEQLPSLFWQTVAYCNKQCAACSYCQELYDQIAQTQEISFKDLR